MKKYITKGLRMKAVGILSVAALLFSVVPALASGGGHGDRLRGIRFDDLRRVPAFRVDNPNRVFVNNIALVRDIRGTVFVIRDGFRTPINNATLVDLLRVRPNLIIQNVNDFQLGLIPRANNLDLFRNRVFLNDDFRVRVDNSGPGSFNSGSGSVR